jgi:hypothetical protein
VVRPPRLELAGDELDEARALISERLSARPARERANAREAVSVAS